MDPTIWNRPTPQQDLAQALYLAKVMRAGHQIPIHTLYWFMKWCAQCSEGEGERVRRVMERN